jgi:hypothetical protein
LSAPPQGAVKTPLSDQRVAKIDDLLQRRAKQIVLTIVARLAHGIPPTANLPSKES